jgi:hypothetical protein
MRYILVSVVAAGTFAWSANAAAPKPCTAGWCKAVTTGKTTPNTKQKPRRQGQNDDFYSQGLKN